MLEALPRMEKAATDSSLKEAFRHHLQETKGHVDRLTKIFAALEFEPGGHKCSAMEGLITEASDILKTDAEPAVRDAALIAAAQRVEHYEMAGYGTARAYAEKLGEYDAADALQKSLNEEGLANQALTRLAERSINFQAMTA
ncbi:MAG: DUF892 family protein [Pirellulales bacterium]